MTHYPDFTTAIYATGQFLRMQKPFSPQRWQGVDVGNKPEMQTYELLNHRIQVPVKTEDLDALRLDINPNLPWADDHFAERVCGAPINPGIEWANWPWGKSASNFLDENGQFNHNYMERYWPKHAGMVKQPTTDPVDWAEKFVDRQGVPPEGIMPNGGIRHQFYGDLNDVVEQLAREPDTRQAYMPVFFPEDTGAVHRGRVPCSLGYQFLYRRGYLHMTYDLRSCDYYRHFRDDIYLTVRLLLWMLDQLRQRPSSLDWSKVQPGIFTLDAMSMHLFKNDYFACFGDAPQ